MKLERKKDRDAIVPGIGRQKKTGDKAGKELAQENARLRRRLREMQSSSLRSNNAEQMLEARSFALAERMKELRCLYSISNLLDDRRISLGEILQQIADTLPSAFQFPEEISVRIIANGEVHQNRQCDLPPRRHSVPIIVNERKVGEIEIGCHIKPKSHRRLPFLPEELTLLNAVAERLSDIAELKEAQSNLSNYQGLLRSLASQLTLVEERERRQLALALHDRIGQGLAVARLKLDTMRHANLDQTARARLEDITILLKQIIDDTRSLTFEISPPVLYELGFVQALFWLSDHFGAQFSLDVRIQGSLSEPELPEASKVMLFRSVQELLTNVVKHAKASVAELKIICAAREFRIAIQDDGQGLVSGNDVLRPGVSAGFGLFSIRERLEHFGGGLALRSSPGKGVCAEIWIPLARVSEPENESKTEVPK